MAKRIRVTRVQVIDIEADSITDAIEDSGRCDEADWKEVDVQAEVVEDTTYKEVPLIGEQDYLVTVMLRLERYGDSEEEIAARKEDEEDQLQEVPEVIEAALEKINLLSSIKRHGEIRYHKITDK